MPFLIHSSVARTIRGRRRSDILDIAEANPDIRFCLAHSCRYDRECLDRVNALPNTWFDCSAHCIHCDGAVADLPYIAPRDAALRHGLHRPRARHRRSRGGVSDEIHVGQRLAVLQLRRGDQRPAHRAHQHLRARGRRAEGQPPEVVDRIADTNTRAWLKLQDESILA